MKCWESVFLISDSLGAQKREKRDKNGNRCLTMDSTSHNVFDCITSIGKLMKTCFDGLFSESSIVQSMFLTAKLPLVNT